MRQGFYSRSVYFLKIVLPMIAIGLLATVFLFTTERTIPGGLNFSPADLDSLESGMQVISPRFSGSSENGDVYSFSASRILPDNPKPKIVTAESLSGQISFLQGTTMLLNAGKAVFQLEDRTMNLFDGMTIVFSDGFRAHAEQMFADLRNGSLETVGTVTATSPMGDIEAGKLRVVTTEENGEENRMIWFEDGVTLHLKTSSEFQED